MLTRLAVRLVLAGLAFGAIPPAHAAGPALTVTMRVDKVVAKRGEILAYRVHVANLGDEAAQALEIQSHFPAQTTEAPTGECPIDVEPCTHVDATAPGLGDSAHQIQFRRVPALAPGQTVILLFKVQINQDAIVGSHVRNHAHASAAGQAQLTSATVDTLIVGAVPNAMFGGSTFSASGKLVTDSYDSSAGTYAATHADKQGDIASNGDITVSGGSIINGNATPGPGHTVTISKNSTVNGSTAPADSVIALNQIEAVQYEKANDNGRLCRVPGSCSSTTYTSATKTLVVGGAASVDPGVYYLCHLDVRGTLVVKGPVTVVIGPPGACAGRGTVSFSSSALVDGAPRDFQLLIEGDPAAPPAVSISGHSSFVGVLYAPNSHVSVDGGSHLFGLSTSGAIAAGSGFTHYDRSLRQ